MPTVNEIISQRICGLLEEGVIPWERPTLCTEQAPRGYDMRPGEHYTGINRILLSLPGEYLTERMVAKYHGRILDRSNYHIATFYKEIPAREADSEDDNDDGASRRVLRYYRVYHISNTEGIRSRLNDSREGAQRSLNADELVRHYGIELVHDTLCADARLDAETRTVYLPSIEKYRNDESYYSALFHAVSLHEFVSSRGSDMRAVNAADRALADMVSEISSGMLMSHCGLDATRVERNSAALIQRCLNDMRADARLISTAARAAEKVVASIVGGEQQENYQENQQAA